MKFILSIWILLISLSVEAANTSNVLFALPQFTLDSTNAIDVGSNLRTNAGALVMAFNRPAVDSSHVFWMAFTNTSETTNVPEGTGNGNGIITTNVALTPWYVYNSSNTPYAGNNALQFDNGRQLSIGANLLFDYTQKWTVWAAVKIKGHRPGVNDAQIIFTDVGPNGTTGYEFWINNSGQLVVKIMHIVGVTEISVHGGTDVTDNIWHMCVATYDGSGNASGVKIYVDGVAESLTVASDTLALGNSVGQGPFLIGNQALLTNQYHLRGMIDDFQLETTNHTAAYIALYATPSSLPPLTTNTCLLLHMDETGGTSLVDSSTNNFACTLNANNMWVSGTNSIRAFMADSALNWGVTDSEVKMADNALYDIKSNWVITVCCNSSVAPAGGMVEKYNNGTGGYFLTGWSGSDQGWMANSFRDFGVTNPAGWHIFHMRFVQGGTLTHWTDGTIDKTLTAIPAPIPATSNPLVIGGFVGQSSAFFNGCISFVAISATNRSDSYLQQFSTRYSAAGIATCKTNMGSPYRIVGLTSALATASNSVVQYRIGSGSSAGAATTDAAAQSWATLSAAITKFKGAGQFIEVNANLIPSTDTLKTWTPALTNLTLTAFSPRRSSGFF